MLQLQQLLISASPLQQRLVTSNQASTSHFSARRGAEEEDSLLHSTLLHSTLLYSTLFHSTLLYSTSLYSTLLYSTLLDATKLNVTIFYSFDFTLFYSTPLYPILLNSTLLYSTPFLSTLLDLTILYYTLLYFYFTWLYCIYSTLPYSTLLRSTRLYCTLLYYTLPYSILLHSTLLYSTLLYLTLLYFTLLNSTLFHSTLLDLTILYSTLFCFSSSLPSVFPCVHSPPPLSPPIPSCQFDSQAVSSLLDMDLDSFSTSTKVSSVTQVDDLWHGRRAYIDAFHLSCFELYKTLRVWFRICFLFSLFWSNTIMFKLIFTLKSKYLVCCISKMLKQVLYSGSRYEMSCQARHDFRPYSLCFFPIPNQSSVVRWHGILQK